MAQLDLEREKGTGIGELGGMRGVLDNKIRLGGAFAAETGTGNGVNNATGFGISLGSQSISGNGGGGGALRNRAGESRSPYVRGHGENPVAWQLWGDEAIERAKRENKLLFVSIGYSACHWCHVMERESFEDQSIANILNSSFIPIKIDREERPDIDRIYMNFVQATTGSGGWPLNVFVTPSLEPVFGGTYWPGPHSNTPQGPLEEQVDFLGILKKLADVWQHQEARCRQDSAQILQQLKDFAADGTFGGSRLGEGEDGLDLELLEEAYQHFASTFDTTNYGFGSEPKFPTPSKLAFLLHLPRFQQPVVDVVGEEECTQAEFMALSTLRAMARGGIRDHIGHGFARYSVTADWSLPHFEKMLYDNAQLLNVYLDAFVATSDPEFLGVVFDLISYLISSPITAPGGAFYSSEDADSFYRRGDSEKREGAFYVWTKRELETLLDPATVDLVCAFYNISSHGNVLPDNDAHDEFINQNVLSIVSTPASLASQFGMLERDVVRAIKTAKATMRAHREAERPHPALDDKIVAAWNGIAVGALARTGAALRDVDAETSVRCLDAARKALRFLHTDMYDEERKVLRRVWREGPGDTDGFADDYAFVIEGCVEFYEATKETEWLRWADELMTTQLDLFYDSPLPLPNTSTTPTGGFFSTPLYAPHTILRLKDGMDTSEPSTNGISACNLLRLSSLLSDSVYESRAKETLHAFESEILQYPWLFTGFLKVVVGIRLGIEGIDGVAQASKEGAMDQDGDEWLKERRCRDGICPAPGSVLSPTTSAVVEEVPVAADESLLFPKTVTAVASAPTVDEAGREDVPVAPKEFVSGKRESGVVTETLINGTTAETSSIKPQVEEQGHAQAQQHNKDESLTETSSSDLISRLVN